MSVLVNGLVLTAAFCSGPVIALTSAKPTPAEIMLVVAAPGTNTAALIEYSGGRAIGPDASVLGALAIADSEAFVERLKANGAWLVRDGTLIAQLCGVTK